MRRAKSLSGSIVAVTAAATLSGCGGGGGGGEVNTPSSVAPPASTNSGASTPAPSTPAYAAQMTPADGTPYVSASEQGQRSARDDGEYRQRYGSTEYVHALAAYDSGWTGKGVTVGQIDDGIDTANPEFAGRISSLSKDFGHTVSTAADGSKTSMDRGAIGDALSDHGTEVASVIAANRNGSGVQGLAYDAQIAVLRVSDADYAAKTEAYTSTNIAAALDYAGSSGIKVINSSVNVAGTYLDPRQVAAIGRFGDTGGLIVSSAGNGSAAAPPETKVLSSDQLRTYLFVGSIDVTGTGWQISSYSNRAGAAADRYVVAPGQMLVATNGGNGAVAIGTGTSFAAPVVTSLAALILQKWPQLTGRQAGDIILSTARDIGDAGVDATYGHGLVDFQAALAPVNPVLSNGSAASSVASSVVVTSGAVGSEAIASALKSVTVLDSFGRQFSGDLSAAVIRPDQRQRVAGLVGQNAIGQVQDVGSPLAHGVVGYSFYGDRARPDQPRAAMNFARIEGQYGQVGYAFGYRDTVGVNAPMLGLGPVSDGFAAYAPQADRNAGLSLPFRRGMRLAATVATGSGYGARATALGIGVRGERGGLRLGMIDERGSVLGTLSAGGLRLGDGARTVMLEGDRSVGLVPGWSVKGYGSVGMTRVRTSGTSLFTRVSSALTSRFGVTLEGAVAKGLFSFGVAQPLNVERGDATLRLGNGYDLATQSLTFDDRRVPLAGSRRMLVSTGYQRALGRGVVRFGVADEVTTTRAVSALASYAFAF